MCLIPPPQAEDWYMLHNRSLERKLKNSWGRRALVNMSQFVEQMAVEGAS